MDTPNDIDGSEALEEELSEVSGDSAEAELSLGNTAELVSISSAGLSSLGLLRAQDGGDSPDVLIVNEGYSLSRDAIFRPHSELELAKIDDLVQQVARYSKMGQLDTMKIMEKLLVQARRRHLHDDVADELLAEPVFDEDGRRDRENAGGPLSRGIDVTYTFEDGGEVKTKSLINRDGSLSSFIAQKAELVDRAQQVVENRKRRFQGDAHAQSLVRAMVGHDSTVISDQPEFVQFYNNPETGAQEVDMNIPVHFTDMQKIAQDCKKRLKLSDEEAEDASLTITG